MELTAGPLKRWTKLINLQLYSQKEREKSTPKVKEKTLLVIVVKHRIIGGYYEQLHTNKLDNLEKNG